MINRRFLLYLLAMPIGLMGIVQLLFAVLSIVVFDDHEETQFFFPASVMLAVALVLFNSVNWREKQPIGARDALVFATTTWFLCGVLGAVPIIWITHVSVAQGVFESISGLTTTGATILSGLDTMPKSFLLYRQFLQWLGGLGVVIFVVAVLPMLNVGGLKLLKVETPGPIKDDKLSPRIGKTAHYLWFVYVVITVMCAASYYLVGMDGFDAIAHSLTTVSTGGFSTHDASMGYFASPALLLVSDVFMLMGAISFALHFRVGSARDIRMYWRDEETRGFLIAIGVLFVAIVGLLVKMGDFPDTLEMMNHALFILISFITSTGYGAGDFTNWPAVVLVLLVVAGYLGGCAGSTAGGNKFIRNILCVKLIDFEIKRLIHPRGVFLLRFQGRPVEASVVSATITFMFIAAFSSLVLTWMMMATGLDFWSAFSAVAACLNVLGPAFGTLSSNFQPVSDTGMWILSVAMVLGRLEYLTLLVLLMPVFWRR